MSGWTLKRHFRAAVKFGLLFSLCWLIFWGIWSLFAAIPVVEKIPWWTTLDGHKIYFQLPFSYHRLLDVPCAFLFTIVSWMSLAFTYNMAVKKYAGNRDDIAAGLVAGLAFVLVAGLAFGLVVGLVVGLGVGLGFGLKLIFSRNLWRSVNRWLIS